MDISKIERIDQQKFGELVRNRMNERDLRYDQVSEELGYPLRILRLVLSGSRRMPPSRLIEIINYFGFSEDEIPLRGEKHSVPKGKGIFISYCHRDSEFLDRLMVHLKPLQRQGLIDPWVDTRLLAGDKWKKEIEKALNSARAAILLISADFLASNFIVENELPPLLHGAEEKGTLIIPVILKPCRFTREKSLNEFQAINSPDEPITALGDYERELIYDTVAQRIEEQFGNDG